MIGFEDELAGDYLAECREHLTAIEADLLAMEKGSSAIDEELVNRVFRAVHSVKGGANFFDIPKIRDLAHQAEHVLARIRSREMAPTPESVRALLQATDGLRGLTESLQASSQVDVSAAMAALAKLSEDARTATDPAVRTDAGLLTLLVEDDFASRLLLQTFLSRYGECHVAVNGKEAVEAYRSILERGEKYDLICMDILMPEMDGRQAVRQVRALEEAHGVLSTFGTKIFMITTVDDVKDVILCFKHLCDAYLMKPVDLAELLRNMKLYGLIK